MHTLQLSIPGLILHWLCHHQLFLRNISSVMNRFLVFQLFLLQGRHLGLMGLATAQKLNAAGTNIAKSITNFFILSLKDQYISYWLKATVIQIPKTGNPGPTPLHHSSLLPSSSPSLTILSLPYYLPELMCPNWGNTTLPPHWVNTICVTQSHKSPSFITMQEAYFLN